MMFAVHYLAARCRSLSLAFPINLGGGMHTVAGKAEGRRKRCERLEIGIATRLRNLSSRASRTEIDPTETLFQMHSPAVFLFIAAETRGPSNDRFGLAARPISAGAPNANNWQRPPPPLPAHGAVVHRRRTTMLALNVSIVPRLHDGRVRTECVTCPHPKNFMDL